MNRLRSVLVSLTTIGICTCLAQACGKSAFDIVGDPISGEELYRWTGKVFYDLGAGENAESLAAKGGPTGLTFDNVVAVLHYKRAVGGEFIEHAYSAQVLSTEVTNRPGHYVGEFSIEYRWHKAATYEIEVLHPGTVRQTDQHDKQSVSKGDQQEEAFIISPKAVGEEFTWSGTIRQQLDATTNLAVDDAVVTVEAFGVPGLTRAGSQTAPVREIPLRLPAEGSPADAVLPAVPDRIYTADNLIESWSDESDSAGAYSIPFAWNSIYAYRVSVKFPGASTASETRKRGLLGNVNQLDDFLLAVPFAVTWTGTVNERFLNDQGAVMLNAPLPGTAEVSVEVNPGSTSAVKYSALTSSSGTYQMQVPWNKDWAYTITARRLDGEASPAVVSRGKVAQPAQGEVLTQNFYLDPAYFDWSGKVETGFPDNTRVPVASATVSMNVSASGVQVAKVDAVSDGSGAYSLTFPYHQTWAFAITVTQAGQSAAALQQTFDTEFARGDRAQQDFLLDSTAVFTWSGSITNSAQEAVADAQAVLITSEVVGGEELTRYVITATTDTSGMYELQFTWSSNYMFSIGFRLAGESALQQLTIPAKINSPGHDQVTDFVLDDAPTYVWRGTIRDVGSAPVPDATLTILATLPGSGGDPDIVKYTVSGVTDAQGHYTIPFRWYEAYEYSIGYKLSGQENFTALTVPVQIPSPGADQTTDFSMM